MSQEVEAPPPPTSVGPSEPDAHVPPPPSARARGKKWVLLLLVALAIGAVDQLSKHWAHTSLRWDHNGRVELVEGYFALTYVRNPGAAWGFLSRQPATFRRPFFTAVSVIAIGFILYLFVRLEPTQYMLAFSLALVLGGALGNFVDRVRFNYVIDFLDFYIGRGFKWPTFNIADVAITGGVFLLFVEMALGTLHARRERKAGDQPSD